MYTAIKTKVESQSSADRITNSLNLALKKKNRQTNINSTQSSPYVKLTKSTKPTLGGWKPNGRKNKDLKLQKRRAQK